MTIGHTVTIGLSGFNSNLSECYFPKELKAGEVSSLFKSLDAFIKKNYRPITVLSSVSKIYERVLESKMKFMPLVSSLLFCVDFERAMEPNMHFYDS